MAIRINNLVLDIEEDINLLREKAAKKIKIPVTSIDSFKVLKESIDARKKTNIKFNYTVEIKCKNEEKLVSKLSDKDVKIEDVEYSSKFEFGTKKSNQRPIIIGMGPAGIFAGLLLAQNGYKPIVFERGERVEDRTESVNQFWKNGVLNLESNVQFGEGGAGTFSDGKLTTRIKDSRCDFVLEEMVKAGAPEEIAYMGKPHIGTDVLKEVVKNIREKIIALGGEVHFNSKVEDFIVKESALKAVVVKGGEVPCETAVFAIGHSARDTYEMLYKKEVFLEPKPFAIGVRIEHHQNLIDGSQYGNFAGHPRLKAAEYRLTHTSEKLQRAIYSFCMCPGGEVVGAASEEGLLVTNGMSYSKRDKENANSAVVVSVGPKDFEGSSPLSGMEFQRKYERLAYELGGGNYCAPIQLVGDFLKDRKTKKLGAVTPTYAPGYEFKELKYCLPSSVIDGLKEGIVAFDRKIKGFGSEEAVLTGIESRTSAPVRMVRNESLQSISIKGLYPAGEGAGYAGGIMSAAVDGIKVAESIMKEWKAID